MPTPPPVTLLHPRHFASPALLASATNNANNANNSVDAAALLETRSIIALLGTLRHLGDIARYAAEACGRVQVDVSAVSARSRALEARVSVLASRVPGLEEAINNDEIDPTARHAITMSWQMPEQEAPSLVSRDTLPTHMKARYEACKAPPQLSLLDRFAVDKVPCMTRYTNPSLFKQQWASAELSRAEEESSARQQRRNEKKKLLVSERLQAHEVAKMPAKAQYSPLGAEYNTTTTTIGNVTTKPVQQQSFPAAMPMPVSEKDATPAPAAMPVQMPVPLPVQMPVQAPVQLPVQVPVQMAAVPAGGGGARSVMDLLRKPAAAGTPVVAAVSLTPFSSHTPPMPIPTPRPPMMPMPRPMMVPVAPPPPPPPPMLTSMLPTSPAATTPPPVTPKAAPMARPPSASTLPPPLPPPPSLLQPPATLPRAAATTIGTSPPPPPPAPPPPPPATVLASISKPPAMLAPPSTAPTVSTPPSPAPPAPKSILDLARATPSMPTTTTTTTTTTTVTMPPPVPPPPPMALLQTLTMPMTTSYNGTASPPPPPPPPMIAITTTSASASIAQPAPAPPPPPAVIMTTSAPTPIAQPPAPPAPPTVRGELLAAIEGHNKSQLRRVDAQVERPLAPAMGRDALLEQIRTKTFRLRRMSATAQQAASKMPVPKPAVGPGGIDVAVILERANNIRQAVEGSDSSDDDWDD